MDEGQARKKNERTKNVQKEKMSARKLKRLEWWSVRSGEVNKKAGDNEISQSKENESQNSEPLKKKVKIEKGPEDQTADSDKKVLKQKKKKKAYVLFVGNLPYTVTTEDIKEHFSEAGGIKEVRLLTRKDSNDSRGCAYVEFENRYSHMCALKMNESLLGGRKINVEFTSRGRNTPKRMERLKEKNKRAARFRQPLKKEEDS